MGFLIGLLTFVLVLDCFLLTLLVLMQLPKKEAGAGVAFGGGATDALFGAGSGNVLTKATKYAAGIFFGLALVIGLLQGKYHHRSVTNLIKETASAPATPAETPGAAPTTTPSASAQSPTPEVTPAFTNFTLQTEVPAEPTTNAPSNQE